MSDFITLDIVIPLLGVFSLVGLIGLLSWRFFWPHIAQADPLDSDTSSQMIQPPSEPYIKRGTPGDQNE